jgi:SH2 domain
MYKAPLPFTRKEEWYHGMLSRQETERRLREGGSGHNETTFFLIRRSSTKPGFYALSMLCSQRLYNFVICKRVRIFFKL